MTDADFGSSQAGEVLLSHVSARAIEAVCLLMVDSLDPRNAHVSYPMMPLVGVDNRSLRDTRANE